LTEFGALVAAAEHEAAGGQGSAEPYPHSTVSRWETNRRRPSESTLRAIAVVGRVPLADLQPAGPDAGTQGRRTVDLGEAPLPTPGVGMTPPLTVWRQGFLLQLAQGGVRDAELEAVSLWLARPVWARAGGDPLLGLSDDAVLDLWARMADVARWCLARRGHGVRYERSPLGESLVPESSPGTPPWVLTREVELRAFRSPTVLEALLDVHTRARGGVRQEAANESD
jgi:transcriptional regulator with XRE-family HTH domain